jgi:hypothetical protein
VDERVDGSADPRGYVPPPPFAPPAWRVAPVNELQVFGRTSYPPALQPTLAPTAEPVPSPVWSPATTTRHQRPHGLSVAVVVLVAAALLVIGTVLVTTDGSSNDRHSLSLPDSAGAYTRVSTISGSQLQNVFTGSGAFGNLAAQDMDHAKVGLYVRGQERTPTLLFVGFSASESPVIGRELRTEAAEDVADDVLLGAGSTSPPLPVDAGPLGGAIECTQVDLDGEPATVGVWADSDTLGIVLLVDPAAPLSTAQAGEVTRAMRANAEH